MAQIASTESTPKEGVAKAAVCATVATVLAALGLLIMVAAWLSGDFRMLFLACGAWTGAFLFKTAEGSLLRAALNQAVQQPKV